MHRLLLAFQLLSAPAFGQTTSSDSQTLQAILAELRQLRRELAATALTTQRIQIALYRLQVEEAEVSRLSQRLDDARSELTQLQIEQKRLAADIKRQEDFIDRADTPSADRKAVETMLPQEKARLEALQTQEQQAQAKESEVRDQLRLGLAKLATVQEDLARLEKTLENAAPPNPR
jgi:hypothetical protein